VVRPLVVQLESGATLPGAQDLVAAAEELDVLDVALGTPCQAEERGPRNDLAGCRRVEADLCALRTNLTLTMNERRDLEPDDCAGFGSARSYNPSVEVRGERVVLRRWRIEDVPAVAAACRDAEIARWLAFVPQPYTEEDARVYIEDCIDAPEHRCPFAITDARGGAVIGSIDIRSNRLRTGHVGYWVAAQARGRGVAPDALRALSGWAFETLGLGRVELVTDPENIASQRVAEKAGFQREATLRSILLNRDGSRRDGVMFSLLPGELD
jgi:RimJ/RimL family protein N-acetyltransferase